MKCFIGIDLGGTIVKIGLESGGSILGVRKINVDSSRMLSPLLPKIEEGINSLIDDSYGFPVHLGGIALAFAGIVDVEKKRAAATNAKYDDAPSINLEEWVRSRWNVPFAMDNDARMAMLGEWMFGAGAGTRNMVMMTIGTGIGTGVVVDSRPLYGKNWCAGSLGGHLVIDHKGRKCTCGNIGCVEAHASSFFLPTILEENGKVESGFAKDVSNANFKTLFDLYRKGDGNARTIVNECMDVWAAAIINYIHAYDPEVVVIGGGIMKSADVILPYLQSRVDSLAWSPGEKVRLVASELGDDAAILSSEYFFG